MISSVCISKNGSMIWNYTDSSSLTMKELNLDEIKSYLKKVDDKKLYALLQANKKKPVKKSKFQQKLEEIAKQNKKK